MKSSTDEDYPGEEDMFARGYLLAGYLNTPGLAVEYDWATPTCIDVRRLGCSVDKPSYWPN